MLDTPKKEYLINRIVDEITKFLIEDYRCTLSEALNIVYCSDVYELLKDESSELYVQSPSYVYELLKKEYLTGNII